MARIVKPLTFVEIDNAKSKEKDYKLIDGMDYFYLLVELVAKFGDFVINNLIQTKKQISILDVIRKLV